MSDDSERDDSEWDEPWRMLKGVELRRACPIYKTRQGRIEKGADKMKTAFKDGDYPADVLDKVQIAALRKADCISFHHNDGKSYIVATKRKERTERDPFASEVNIAVSCKWSLTNYDGWPTDTQSLQAKEFKAFEMIHTPSHDPCWQTIAGLLKPGDIIRLRWLRGSTTEAQRDARMATDSLSLEIERDNKELVFLVRQLTTDSTSTARTVRRC